MEKISIIVPIYKVEEYLDKCVTSLINQTYKNIEIILVDDGSPDNCPKMCDEWQQKDERIKVIHKPNGGLSDARNVGIEASTGDYIMLVDSDDYVDETILEKLYNTLKETDVDFSMCGALKFYENDTNVLGITYNLKPQIFRGSEVIGALYEDKITYLMTAWAKLYKRKIFDNIKYPKGKIHEDEFTIHHILHASNSFAVIEDKLYFYLQRGNSIMGKRNKRNVEHITEAFKERYEFLNKNYPNNKEQNISAYLKGLRGAYVVDVVDDAKELKESILKEYLSHYKQLKKHNTKDLLFKHFRWLYKILYKIKMSR